MADKSEIEIEITLNDGQVVKGLARIGKDGLAVGASVEDAFKKAGKAIAGLGVAYLGFNKLKDFFLSSVDAAANQEAAIARVNASLRLAGTFSQAASQAFQSFASEIQKTTAIEDDQVLSLSAVARSMSRTNEQALELTRASIELGAATGKGPEAAMQSLAGTLSGTAGRLAKFIPELNNFTAEQLKAGAAIEFVNARFGGSAAAELNTFSGRVANLKNVFGDFKEELGRVVTSSPALLAVFKFVSERVIAAGEAMGRFASSGDVLKPLILGLIDLGTVINYSIIGSLEAAFNVARVVFDGFKTLQQAQINFWAQAASKIVGFFAPNSELKKTLDIFAESSRDVLNDFTKDVSDSTNKLFNFDATKGIGQALSDARAAVEQAAPVMQENLKGVGDSAKAVGDEFAKMSGQITSVGQSFSLFGQGFMATAQTFRADAQKNIADAGGQAFRSLSAGVSSGMAAIGKTLVKGGDIFKAFAGAMIGALGQAAMQMGATYILLGLARVLASYGADSTGYQLMGVGAGLSVLGGALMAMGEGVNGPATASGSYAAGGGGVGTPGDIGQGANPANEVREERGQRLTVNIQGDVLDSRESGLRIIEMINDAGFASGGKVFA